MTRHEQIRKELRELYERSRKAVNPNVIREIEFKISCLETEAASILT